MSKIYSRNEFAEDLALRLKTPVSRAKVIVNEFIDLIESALVAGSKLEFRNFGVLEVVVRKKKIGRNPAKPDVYYEIPERKRVRFRAGEPLSEKLNPDQS